MKHWENFLQKSVAIKVTNKIAYFQEINVQ